MSSIHPILNCSDRSIQQNQGFVWGSHLQRLQNLTSVNSNGCVPFYSSNLRLPLEPYFVLKDDGKVYEWQWTKPDGFLSLRLIICRCFFCLFFSVARFFPSLQCNFNCIEAKLKYQVELEHKPSQVTEHNPVVDELSHYKRSQVTQSSALDTHNVSCRHLFHTNTFSK